MCSGDKEVAYYRLSVVSASLEVIVTQEKVKLKDPKSPRYPQSYSLFLLLFCSRTRKVDKEGSGRDSSSLQAAPPMPDAL